MNFKNIVLSRSSQTQKSIYSITHFIFITRKDISSLSGRNRSVLAEAEGGMKMTRNR